MHNTADPKTDVDRLPPHLGERVRVIRDAPLKTSGEFVLYWMHHAVRSHENPALDTALTIAGQLKKPVLVYQGLGGRHRFNSDRHHTFIMEGAREVQQHLGDRHIAYAFYLGRQPSERTPLTKLARRAALVITEDFPAPPFPSWTRQLAGQMDAALWAVDCACNIPMRTIGRTFTRAYAFRNHTWNEYERRLGQGWDEVEPVDEFFDGDCGFDATDLAHADIAELCAQCEIDHTIAPVAHSPGGSAAGYARWEKFKRHGLKRYARLRNDAAIAFPEGVSRLSAYLHHGHISPFRIAREAFQDGSNGAMKYLDELLIWRELSHHFCFHHSTLETLDALPQWARRTLLDHAGDPRPAVYSWERLCRGQTGDLLWDAAQRSLLVHGELHNNVRMTWGKAFLQWAHHPQRALDLMIDLNHRFALDGSDANSYGGLLWCLGLFDRPFQPERAVIGTLRPRPTGDHARRLDMGAYTGKVKGPADGHPLRIAVIGAGLSGLIAARTLTDHGHRVRVYEKSDRPGGRTAARLAPPFAFDAGAQYFTVRDERLKRFVRAWQSDGIVQPWNGKVSVVKGGQISSEKQFTERWVGIPAMENIAAHLADGIDIECEVTVAALKKADNSWRLLDSDRTDRGSYDVVIVAAPPSPAGGLADADPLLRNRIADVKMQPCLAVMVAFEAPLALPFDAAFVHDSPVRWVARNNSKAGRPESECWVFHAGAQWSHANAGQQTDRIVRLLVGPFLESIGHPPVDPIYAATCYWESAAATHPLNVGCLWDADRKIGLCGDWCQKSRMEGAVLSGMSMAGRILGMNTGRPSIRKNAGS